MGRRGAALRAGLGRLGRLGWLGLLGRLGRLGLLGAGGNCSPSPEASPPDEPRVETPTGPRGWHYTVALDRALGRVDVHLCFDGPPPRRLIPGIPIAAEYAHDMRSSDGAPLPREGRAYRLESLGVDACLDYRVDVTGLEGEDRVSRMLSRAGASLMIQPRLWLWRPDMLPAGATSTLRVSAPDGVHVSVPWATKNGAARDDPRAVFVLDRSAFHWMSFSVFGALRIERFERAGAQVELVTLDAPLAASAEGMRTWLASVVDAVAKLSDGRFPRERLQLVLIPTRGDGDGGPVYFGMATRGGGPGVFVFVDDRAPAERFPGDWTTVHELLHHGMPFIDDPWMSEGWVSYYTELMLTRAGLRDEREGWRALVRGFERGRRNEVERSLGEASDQMSRMHAYHRVYWGGAAIALRLDVQMRQQTDGARGLDDAIEELRRCCGDADRRWPASELLAALDRWYGQPLFTQTAAAMLAKPGFPAVEAELARVGVHVLGDEVRFDEDPAKAALRRAIMAPRP